MSDGRARQPGRVRAACNGGPGKLAEVAARELHPVGAAGPQQKVLAEKRRSEKVMGHPDLHYEE
jgi:hypothetical protein